MSVSVAALWALLLCGHVLADFVFQTARMVREKRSKGRGFLSHGIEVGIVQAAVVLPFFPHALGLLFVVGIAFAHTGIDKLKVAVGRRWDAPLTWFVLDQLLHLATLAAIGSLWIRRFDGAPPTPWGEDVLADVRTAALAVAIFGFNANGGSALVAFTLRSVGVRWSGDSEEGVTDPPIGRLIGILERMLILVLVTIGEWGAVGLVIAAKSVARFKQLDEREFAEKYLVGTMASVLVAVASGLLLNALLR